MGIEESAILQVFIDDHAAHACEQPPVSARANRPMLVSPCRLRAPGVNDDDPAAALYDRVQSFLEPGLADPRPLGDQRISADRKSQRLHSSHKCETHMPPSA